MAMGTGTATPDAADTELETPVDLDTADAWPATDSVNSSVKYRSVATLTSGAAQTISEVGLFNAADMSAMLFRQVFTGVVVNDNDTLTFTIDITVA
jgi:hypothetical protein